MNVSLKLTRIANSTLAGTHITLRDIDIDTALALSAALRALPHADVEATIVVENLPSTQHTVRPTPKTPRAGLVSTWLRHLRLLDPAALTR
jgi:hypothetical protein